MTPSPVHACINNAVAAMTRPAPIKIIKCGPSLVVRAKRAATRRARVIATVAIIATGIAQASCSTSIAVGVLPSCMFPERIGPTNRARIAPRAPNPTTFFTFFGSVTLNIFAASPPITEPVATSATSGPSTTPPHSDARIARIAPRYSLGVSGLTLIPPNGEWPVSPTNRRIT